MKAEIFDSRLAFRQIEATLHIGWSPILRHIGADTGDIALAEFDLTKSVVQISLADEAILEED